MKIVIDTNIIFSALLSQNNKFQEIIFTDSYQLFSPNFVLIEILKHQNKLLNNSKLNSDELLELLHLLTSRIEFISETTISSKNKKKAYEFCKNVDLNDTPFVALCLELNAKLWTGDKKLKDGINKEKFIDLF
ncbi:MAG TPA: PIN domain-containing protein [Ignavibacteria bacterium]|nr:PIN domain-containing protein [Ignavibacteria bacterium]